MKARGGGGRKGGEVSKSTCLSRTALRTLGPGRGVDQEPGHAQKRAFFSSDDLHLPTRAGDRRPAMMYTDYSPGVDMLATSAETRRLWPETCAEALGLGQGAHAQGAQETDSVHGSRRRGERSSPSRSTMEKILSWRSGRTIHFWSDDTNVRGCAAPHASTSTARRSRVGDGPDLGHNRQGREGEWV